MLEIGDWKFRVDTEESRLWLSAQGHWGFEVVCEASEIPTPDGLKQRFAPTLSIRDLPFDGRDWRGLGGLEVTQEGAWQGDGEPVADLFVVEHTTVFEARLRVLGPEGNRFTVELDALGDVFFDDTHDTDVPVKLRVELPFDGVEFRFRAEGKDTLAPAGKARTLLGKRLDPDAFAEPRIKPIPGSPGVFQAHFVPGEATRTVKKPSKPSASGKKGDPVLEKAARELLEGLVAQDLLEVEEGGLDRIAGPLVAVLEEGGRGERRAARVSGWLIDHEDVVDLHIQDDDLAELLDKWW